MFTAAELRLIRKIIGERIASRVSTDTPALKRISAKLKAETARVEAEERGPLDPQDWGCSLKEWA
jgi:hypothetical protein